MFVLTQNKTDPRKFTGLTVFGRLEETGSAAGSISTRTPTATPPREAHLY